MQLRTFLAASLVLMMGGLAIAQDAEKIVASDIDAYLKVEATRALADARKNYVHDRAEREKLDHARIDAIKAAGVSEEHYEAASSLIITISDALAALDSGGDEAEVAKETLKDVDKSSIALVKARLKEVRDNQGRSKKAAEQAKQEHDAAARGAPPDPTKLAGTWNFDIDATISALGLAGNDEASKKVREGLTKSGVSSYTFGPGDAIASTVTDSDGKTRTDKGTYRLDGNTLYIRADGSKREQTLTVGMKGDALALTMFGMQMYFKKQ